jgi:hypothetical protein
MNEKQSSRSTAFRSLWLPAIEQIAGTVMCGHRYERCAVIDGCALLGYEGSEEEGSGKVESTSFLFHRRPIERQAMRLRPDHIILGEARGPEALETRHCDNIKILHGEDKFIVGINSRASYWNELFLVPKF